VKPMRDALTVAEAILDPGRAPTLS
jgi:hypothetical protein